MHTRAFLNMAATSLAVAFSTLTQGLADDVSRWDSDARSAIRLVAGVNTNGAARLRAGIEMRLDSGWKTYWRYAGDSGLPPAFDFQASKNVQTVSVLWPAPRRFPDGAGGNSIGYMGNVIFPVHVIAQDSAKPVTLRLKATYGACEKICIPAAGEAELSLAPTDTAAEEAALAAAEARVPKHKQLGESGTLIIHSVHREVIRGERPRVVVEVTAPDAANVDLFAEGPAPQWSLPLPQLAGKTSDGKRRFVFEVDGVPPESKIEGALLRFTLLGDEEAIEVTTHLD